MKNKNKIKSFKRLNLDELIQIEIQYSQGKNLGEIARHLGKGRNKSTISREIGGRPRKGSGKYEAYQANCRAVEREEKRGKRERLKNETTRKYAKEKLKLGWTPEQIEMRIGKDYRPKVIEKRKEIGHFEGDTIVSRESKPRLKTLNERVCGVVFIGKTKDGTTDECNNVVLQRLKDFPKEYRKTLTQDRGTENFDYRPLEKELEISCYFAHAYCSQERGSNENLNGLIRRYFPKGTDFAKVSDEEIARVESLLNNRPRKRFGGLTPLEVLFMKTGVALKY